MSRVVVNEIQVKIGNDISFNDTVKIDTIKGKTTAGSISIQGEGTNTLILQQGLIKVWCHWDNDADGIHDSFNVTSFTDVGSGATRLTYTNNMSSGNYSIAKSGMHDGGTHICDMYVDHDTPPTTSQVDFDLLANSSNVGLGTRLDMELCSTNIAGDLA
mgnify:FL=1